VSAAITIASMMPRSGIRRQASGAVAKGTTE